MRSPAGSRASPRVGIQIFPDEVVATGWPWRTTVCVRGRDYLRDATGATVYENRYVIWGRMAWGRLKDYEVYEDTHKADALDEYLDAAPAGAGSGLTASLKFPVAAVDATRTMRRTNWARASALR